MGSNVIEDRLRAARPDAAHVEENAFDAELLAHVQRLPVERHRTSARRIAIPAAAAGVTLAAAAALMFAGGPGDIGGPSSAAAIEQQAMRWFSPPSGTVLHVRSIETQGGRTTTRESWQSADDPTANRELLAGTIPYETMGESLYDPTSNTIYLGPTGKTTNDEIDRIIGDPVVKKVRFGLENHDMTVTGRERHNGQDAYAISLNPDAGRPVWTVWVSASNGKPLELRDPGRDATEEPSVIRWETYEVLDGADADQLVSLQGAHPTAKVVRDPAQVGAAWDRVFGDKDRRAK